MSVTFLQREGQPDLAYQRDRGTSSALPGVVFLGGFRSDMQGTKAAFLADHCRARGQNFIRFDYRGHGQSGGAFKDGTIGLWLEDALAVIAALTEGKIILVGSSMGGWIGLLAALARKDKVAGFIGIAAAPDFTQEIRGRITEGQRKDLDRDGYFKVPNEYSDDPYMITSELIEDGESHCLLHAPIALDIPVRLMQGMKDSEVPWQKAHRIVNAITGEDKKVFLVEEGDHGLSRPQDLSLLASLVVELSEKIN